MITISLSPNTERDDAILAFKTLLQPGSWMKGNAVKDVEEWFKKYLQNKNVFAVDSGRTALYLLLQSYDIKSGDEVVVQAFTCLAVPEVVKWVGAKPVFADIDETLNIDPVALEKSITPKTRVIIVQHTFGIPANIELIIKIVQKHNLILIEDCAHALGALYQGKQLGTFGDAAFFSFGRDKIISSVFGGLLSINSRNKNAEALKNFLKIKRGIDSHKKSWVFQQLLHPIAFSVILPTYNVGIGKLLLVLLQKLKLLSFPIFREETRGTRPGALGKLLPNGLAILALNQLKKLAKLNIHRQKLAAFYFQNLKKSPHIKLPEKIDGAVYLRFNILTDKPATIRNKFKNNGILLGNWYHDVIDPSGTSSIAGYEKYSCPNAEVAAGKSLNLPTNINISFKDAERIIKLLQ